MIPFDTLCAAWLAERAYRTARYAARPRLGEEGLTLGPMTVIAKRVANRWGEPVLAIDEERILALLAVACWRPAALQIIDTLHHVSKTLSGRNPTLAPILITQAGLGRIDETEQVAFRLFCAEKLLDARVAPRELVKGLGLSNYAPDQPRVPAGNPDGGQWTSEGGAGSGDLLQYAQEIIAPEGLPPELFLARPPINPNWVPKAPFEKFPDDPTQPPGPGYQWFGRPGSKAGDKTGNWYNPETGEWLRDDTDHPPGQPPHWDYGAPNGKAYRWLPDGTLAPKPMILIA